MKWYKWTKASEEGRSIIACYVAGPNLEFYRRLGGPRDDVDWTYWAYADEVDLQKDIIDNLPNSTKTTQQQYTGKRLISI